MRTPRQALKNKRMTLGSRVKVAPMLGISASYLKYLEDGSMSPGRDLMIRLSIFFNETPENLFPDVYEKNKESVKI